MLPSEAALIEAHKLAQGKLKNAKRIAVLLPVLLILATFIYASCAFTGFLRHQFPKVVKEIMRQSPDVLTPVLGEVGSSFTRVAKVYFRDMRAVFQRDWPIYEKLIKTQGEELKKYSQDLKDKSINALKEAQGKVIGRIEDRLVPQLTSVERERFGKAMSEAFYQRLQQKISSRFDAQMTAVKSIRGSLQSITENTPLPENASPQYLAGMGLELLALEIEEASQK